MKASKLILVSLLIFLLIAGPGNVSAQDTIQEPDAPVFLRLKAGTFDPLLSEPLFPKSLTLDAYPGSVTGPYIVQFNGPVEETWKEQLASLGGTIIDYLPDYAFIVQMDNSARTSASNLAGVRWIGLFQPAYKISPDLVEGKPNMLKVLLFPGTDLEAIRARLASLNTQTVEVTGETFILALPEGNLSAVAAWPEVMWMEPFRIPETHNDIATGIMNASPAWTAGLTGSGMMVTVADTGIDSGTDNASVNGDMHPDFDNRLSQIHSWPVQSDGCSNCCWTNPGADDTARDLASGHGTHVLGSVAGNGNASAGQIKGLAYQANLTFQAVEQFGTFTPYCQGFGYPASGYILLGIPENLTTLFQEAYNWGSRIHSNSWGSPVAGEYTTDSRSVDEFIWNHPDMTILFAAGNSGVDSDNDGYVDQDSINSPGTAKNAITSGASDNERTTGGLAGLPWSGFGYGANPTGGDTTSDSRQEMAAFSSRGPTNDGRIKPDLVAPGTNILSTKSGFSGDPGWGLYSSNPEYFYNGGTSMATPLMAGAATLVREYYVEKRGTASPSAALIKATLINTATDITGYGNITREAGRPIPNNDEGWGLVNVGAAVSGQRFFVDGETVSPGVTRTYNLPVNASTGPLKISLAWSDYPAATTASPQLVNNLNLKVTAPDGVTTYWGNRFSGGWSVTGGSADTINNVENVYIQNPAAGTWKVEVIGANVPQFPQPFALVGPQPPINFNNHVYVTLVQKATALPAHLSLAKTVINNNGGTATAANFNLSAAGPTPLSGAGTASGDVTAGTYTLTESGPAGYTASGWVCTGGAQVGNQVTLTPGQSASCSITNDDQAPSPLLNPGFESGHTGWIESSTTSGIDLITQTLVGSATPHGGSWAVWLGGVYSDTSYIQQQVTVPVSTPYLAYWRWIASADYCGYDYGKVMVNSSQVSIYDLCSSNDTNGWVHIVLDLSGYAGQSVSLQIRSETDDSFNSNLFIDDVTFQATLTPISVKRGSNPLEGITRDKEQSIGQKQ